MFIATLFCVLVFPVIIGSFFLYLYSKLKPNLPEPEKKWVISEGKVSKGGVNINPNRFTRPPPPPPQQKPKG